MKTGLQASFRMVLETRGWGSKQTKYTKVKLGLYFNDFFLQINILSEFTTCIPGMRIITNVNNMSKGIKSRLTVYEAT